MQAIRASRCREPFTFLEIVNILSLHNPEAPYNNKTIPLYRLPTSLTLKPIPNSRQFALLVRVCDVPFNLVGFFCSNHGVDNEIFARRTLFFYLFVYIIITLIFTVNTHTHWEESIYTLEAALSVFHLARSSAWVPLSEQPSAYVFLCCASQGQMVRYIGVHRFYLALCWASERIISLNLFITAKLIIQQALRLVVSSLWVEWFLFWRVFGYGEESEKFHTLYGSFYYKSTHRLTHFPLMFYVD